MTHFFAILLIFPYNYPVQVLYLWELAMKIFIPRNISGGWLNMSVTIGPASISVVQLMILAIGLGMTLGVWNTLYKGGTSRGVAFAIALPIFLICVFVAFFKQSELTLLPFIAKLVRTYFLDATQKRQVNRDKPDPKAIALAKSRKEEQQVIIEQKWLVMDKRGLDTLNRIADHS
jgi:hypothetical protein